ncbi:MAG: hypothetical protein VR68_03930 [Peptococcaceae bacterium BRH_c4a]|nr:MAG: hypothetical protein VR68_03930 [Peptococcaceae bacterium BRH_c4a]
MSFWVAVILSVAAGLSILFAAYRLYLPVKVLAPREDIKAGSVIGEKDIAYLTVSRKDMHSMAVTNPGQVVGRYARDRLYSREPILSIKLTTDERDLIGISGNLERDETYITFKPNEARWPNGLKSGDSVSVVAVVEGGIPRVMGERIKVLNISGQKTAAGQIDQIKNVVSSSDNSITLSMKWAQAGPLFYGKTLSKELWIMPEHPAKDPGGDIYDPVQLEQIRKEIFNENSAAKRNTKAPRPVS